MTSYLNIKADGFRSLRNIEFRLNHGLNVLAGPNGSGKTNLVALLDFLSEFISHGAHAAIAKLGGAARVFSNEDLEDGKSRRALFTASINGSASFQGVDLFDDSESPSEIKASRKLKTKKMVVEIYYHLELSLDKSVFSVSVQHEELRWKVDGGPEEYISYRAPGRVDISDNVQDNILKTFGDILSATYFETMQRHYQDDPIESQISNGSRQGKSILQSVSPPPASGGAAARRAITFGRSFNISPDKVRSPEDIASATPLGSDGSGVITKLYDMIPRTSKGRRAKSSRSSNIERILSQFCQINDNITGIDVHPDLKTGRLQASITVVGKRSNLTIPLESVSDGTAKWLAMLVIIDNTSGGYCVEEPENYLHPHAQRLFLSALRDRAKRNENQIFMVTTHSETVINNSRPSELLICEYDLGSTHVRRLSDTESIEKAINKTGFGLGFLYANDRL